MKSEPPSLRRSGSPRGARRHRARERRGTWSWSSARDQDPTAATPWAERTPPRTRVGWRPTWAVNLDLIIVAGGASLLTDEYRDLDMAIVEPGRFGGTCLNVGCIPTKC
ncbi:hypothetical protein QJS66_05760 [Kocuria rhizophila]|nr:hypothetical protein QJS66_05760 [Kocuria rhizophila]